MNPGPIIKHRRKQRGLTQARCALMAGMAQCQWAEIESGCNITVKTLERVAVVLGCRPGELLGEHEMTDAALDKLLADITERSE